MQGTMDYSSYCSCHQQLVDQVLLTFVSSELPSLPSSILIKNIGLFIIPAPIPPPPIIDCIIIISINDDDESDESDESVELVESVDELPAAGIEPV